MNFNRIGFVTLVRRELRRTLQIVNQVVWPPLISTLLYILIIGLSVGSRIQIDTGVPYVAFLIPGLVALTVIESSYGEGSSSLFQHRFMNSIQELLVAPLSYWEIVGGFIFGSVVRALVLGCLLLLFLPTFSGLWPGSWVLTLLLMTLISVLFTAIGLLMALYAEKWDQIAIPQVFVFTPLIWVGGAFSPLQLLPASLQTVARFNPMFYIIDGLRQAVLGVGEAPFWVSLLVTLTLSAGFLYWVLHCFKTGFKLRV